MAGFRRKYYRKSYGRRTYGRRRSFRRSFGRRRSFKRSYGRKYNGRRRGVGKGYVFSAMKKKARYDESWQKAFKDAKYSLKKMIPDINKFESAKLEVSKRLENMKQKLLSTLDAHYTIADQKHSERNAFVNIAKLMHPEAVSI